MSLARHTTALRIVTVAAAVSVSAAAAVATWILVGFGEFLDSGLCDDACPPASLFARCAISLAALGVPLTALVGLIWIATARRSALATLLGLAALPAGAPFVVGWLSPQFGSQAAVSWAVLAVAVTLALAGCAWMLIGQRRLRRRGTLASDAD